MQEAHADDGDNQLVLLECVQSKEGFIFQLRDVVHTVTSSSFAISFYLLTAQLLTMWLMFVLTE